MNNAREVVMGQVKAEVLEPVCLKEVTAMLRELSKVMIKEIDCLKEMDVRGIEGLQQQKILLGASIEMARRNIEKDPSLAASFSDEDKEQFRKIKKIYEEVARENAKRIEVAREVNRQMVNVIYQVVKEAEGGSFYTGTGNSAEPSGAISMKLNETV